MNLYVCVHACKMYARLPSFSCLFVLLTRLRAHMCVCLYERTNDPIFLKCTSLKTFNHTGRTPPCMNIYGEQLNFVGRKSDLYNLSFKQCRRLKDLCISYHSLFSLKCGKVFFSGISCNSIFVVSDRY